VPCVITTHNARCRVETAAGYSSGFRLCELCVRECREETFTQLEPENRMGSYQFENLCFGGWEYYNSSYRITTWGCGL